MSRYVFMGTPEFAVPSLKQLAATREVALVLTRPDAPRKRGRALVYSPVKAAALEFGLPVRETKRITPELQEEIFALGDVVLCVAAFGCILPASLLSGVQEAFNVHGSLLPQWRGAAPIQRGILAGDMQGGISIMRMVEALDAGPWCRQKAVSFEGRYLDELFDELAKVGASELVAALDDFEQGTLAWHDQDETQVTFAPKLVREDVVLDATYSADELWRRVRASSDSCPACVSLGDLRVRVLKAHVVDEPVLAQGEVSADKRQLWLGCADGTTLALDELKPDGKKAQNVQSFLCGQRALAHTWSASV